MNNKISWIAVGLGVLALIVSIVVGGNNQPQSIVKEIVREIQPNLGGPSRFSQLGAGDAIEFWKKLSIGSGAQSVCVNNVTGSTIFVDPVQTQVHLTGDGIASSSMTLNIATSSDGTNIGGLVPIDAGGYYTGSSTIGQDSNREVGLFPYATILDSFVISTSTGSTNVYDVSYGTSSAAFNAYIRETVASSTGGRILSDPGWVTLPEQVQVCALLTSTYELPLVAACQVKGNGLNDNNCETATSSSRGFDVDVFLKFIATSTQNSLP